MGVSFHCTVRSEQDEAAEEELGIRPAAAAPITHVETRLMVVDAECGEAYRTITLS